MEIELKPNQYITDCNHRNLVTPVGSRFPTPALNTAQVAELRDGYTGCPEGLTPAELAALRGALGFKRRGGRRK
jgi:hypothetical protein